MCLLALCATGCLGGKKTGGSLGEEAPPPDDSAPQCGSAAGMLEGAVYYWGLPGDPDSIAADSVDVFLTNGGPTYRTPTSVEGTFSVPVEAGEWLVAADDPNGCGDEHTEQVTVTPCETTTVELLIDLCSF